MLNPLIIRRFIQIHLGKSKTDRKDAYWLLRYGQQQAVKPWQPAESVLVECRQLEQVTEQLLKQKTMVSNLLEALQRQPVISTWLNNGSSRPGSCSMTRCRRSKPSY
ncbi:transposase (plasmid) [Hymenobacter sp. BRD67]|nr:transposase [Hymenobacter sp. BRD67]